MEYAADGESFVIIQRMVEEASGDSVAIEHQIFANEAGGVGQTVGKLLVGGEQEQTRGFRAVGADDDRLSSLEMSVLLLVEINGPSGAATTVQLYAMDVGVRPNLAAAGALSKRDHTREGAGFRANFTTKAPAKAAVHARAASGTRLRKNRHRRGKGVPAELACGAFENHTG